MDDDGYTGPAELEVGGRVVAANVRLAGYFEPIAGKYRWYGRVDASPEVAGLAGERNVTLRTPHASVETALGDADPWGRLRVEGFGAAPFPVTTDL